MTQPTANLLAEALDPFDSVTDIRADPLFLTKYKRNQIRQILKSYHQRYDHLLESLQNAIDACERLFDQNFVESDGGPYVPAIDVFIDVDNNFIDISDNATGMGLHEVKQYLFTPFSSDKSDTEGRQRGEKGVGNLFLSYGSASYEFATKSITGEGRIAGKTENAIEWVLADGPPDPIPKVIPTDLDLLSGRSHGTRIRIQFSELTNITQLVDCGTTVDQWEIILRMHTGVGYIESETTDNFLRALIVRISVKHDNETKSRLARPGYCFPHHIPHVTSVQKRSLTRGSRGRFPQRQRMKDLIWDQFNLEEVKSAVHQRLDSPQNPLTPRITNALRKDLEEREPSAYICFTWANEFWEAQNKAIFGDGSEEFDHGLVFASSSQRLGESKKIDFSYRTGDYNRFHIVLHMKGIEPDIGRKSLDSRTTRLANYIANTYHTDFLDNADALRPTPSRRSDSGDLTREQLLDDATQGGTEHAFPDLGFIKEPREEQDVVSLFNNLLGAGLLKGLKIDRTYISEQYDGVGYFILDHHPSVLYGENNKLGIPEERFHNGVAASTRRNFIEFKFTTDDLIRDIQREDKALSHITWLICWEMGERHIAEDIEIVDITTPDQKNLREYYGVTDLMRGPSQELVHVIRLKKVLELLREQDSV